MTGKTYQTTLLIRGDSKNAVREVQLTRGELEKLTGAQSKNVPVSQRMGQAFQSANAGVGRLTTSLQGLGGLLGAIGLGAFVRKTIDSADAFAQMQGQLKLVTDSQEELNQVYSRALNLATATGQATETTVNLYARLARSTEELQLSQDQLFTITQAVNQSFVVSGASAQESSSAILQLSQGLAAGALRGEELNSVMENSPRLARALADGLGVSIGQLRELGSQGELTAEAVTQALLVSAQSIDGEFQEMPMTIGRAMQELTNEVNAALGEVDTGPLQEAVRSAKAVIADPGFRQSIQSLAAGLLNLVGAFGKALSAAQNFGTVLGEEIARRIHGIASDDVPALYRELDKATKMTEGFRGRIQKLNGTYDYWIERQKTLREQIAAATEAQRQAAQATQRQAESNDEAAVSSERAADATRRQSDATRDLAQVSFLAADGQLSLADASGEVEKSMAAAAASTGTAKESLVALGREADPVAAAIERGGERMDDAFAGFFRTMLREGRVSFDGLKNLALDTLAEIIYAYARNKVIVGVGLGGFGSAASAATGIAGGGGGLLSGGLSGIGAAFGGGVTNLLQSGAGFFEGIGFDAGARAFTGLENNLVNAGGGNIGLGTLGSVGAGLAGGFLGNQVFGPTSGIGSTLGGLAGSLIPIPFLGTALGSFLGSGLESLFGSDPNQISTGVRFAASDRPGEGLVAGQARIYDPGNEETDRAAMEIAGVLDQFRQAIGGSNQDVVFDVGNQNGLYLGRQNPNETGPNFNGFTFNYGQDTDAFFRAAFEQMLSGANQLSPALRDLISGFEGSAEELTSFAASVVGLSNSIEVDVIQSARDAWDDLNDTTRTAMGVYREQSSAVRDMARNFDGSAAAAGELNQALAMNGEMARQLATAIFQASAQIATLTTDSAKFIRQSVMSEEELRAAREAERESLVEGLRSLADPAAIQQAVSDIERLNTQIFQSLSPEAQVEMAEGYAQSIERVGEIAAERLEAAEADLRREREETTSEIAAILSGAAAQQQQAANAMSSAVQNFAAWVGQLQAQPIRVESVPALMPESNR